MRVAIQLQVAQVFEGFSPALFRHGVLADITPKYLSHFDVEQMRRVQGFRRG
jgi:hypothetical protein